MTNEVRAKLIAEKADEYLGRTGWQEVLEAFILKQLTEACEEAYNEGYEEAAIAYSEED